MNYNFMNMSVTCYVIVVVNHKNIGSHMTRMSDSLTADSDS